MQVGRGALAVRLTVGETAGAWFRVVAGHDTVRSPSPAKTKRANMPHIVTGRCVDCRYTDCCTVCPVDCFYQIEDPKMLVIDPDTCIDCQLCVPECPVHAIYADDEMPEAYQEWVAKNAELWQSGALISEKSDPLPGAKTLDQIQQAEKDQGMTVDEPRNA